MMIYGAIESMASFFSWSFCGPCKKNVEYKTRPKSKATPTRPRYRDVLQNKMINSCEKQLECDCMKRTAARPIFLNNNQEDSCDYHACQITENG